MSEESATVSERYPSGAALHHAAKIGVADDKPILFDYWGPSVQGVVMIGVRDNEEKLLVKNEEEYTSPIKKIFRADGDLVVVTENSIYMVADNVQSRRIS